MRTCKCWITNIWHINALVTILHRDSHVPLVVLKEMTIMLQPISSPPSWGGHIGAHGYITRATSGIPGTERQKKIPNTHKDSFLQHVGATVVKQRRWRTDHSPIRAYGCSRAVPTPTPAPFVTPNPVGGQCARLVEQEAMMWRWQWWGGGGSLPPQPLVTLAIICYGAPNPLGPWPQLATGGPITCDPGHN